MNKRCFILEPSTSYQGYKETLFPSNVIQFNPLLQFCTIRQNSPVERMLLIKEKQFLIVKENIQEKVSEIARDSIFSQPLESLRDTEIYASLNFKKKNPFTSSPTTERVTTKHFSSTIKESTFSSFEEDSCLHILESENNSFTEIFNNSEYIQTNEEEVITEVTNNHSIGELLFSEEKEQGFQKDFSFTEFQKTEEDKVYNWLLYTKLLICESFYEKSPHIFITKSIPITGFISSFNITYSSHSSKGSLPDFTFTSFLSPSIIRACVDIFQITCGYEFCSALSKEGQVYTWGFGGSGCLGQGSYHPIVYPNCIDELSEIVFIESGGYHTAAINSEGEIFVWGRSDFNELGVSTHLLTPDIHGLVALSPEKIQYFDELKIDSVACGEAHTLVLTCNGKIFSFGWGEEGQLGIPLECLDNGQSRDIHWIEYFNEEHVTKIGTGGFFSACLTDMGKFFVWGLNNKGQLGVSSGDISCIPVKPLLETVVYDFYCGRDHIVVLTENASYAWGEGLVEDLPFNEEKVCCKIPFNLETFDPILPVLIKNY